MIAKALIVLIGFPVFGHAVFTGMSMLLDIVLPVVLPLVGGWSDILGQAGAFVSIVVAAHTSFRFCRRLWPTPRVTA
jgi:hypothetical protein